MRNLYKYYYNIKYVCLFIIYLYIFFLNYIFIDVDNKTIIEIDNEFHENLYENEFKFDKYQTKLKSIAFYYPEYNNISYSKYYNKTLKQEHFDINEIKKVINSQIKLATNHQIYGFAIYYNYFNPNNQSRLITNVFSNDNNFPFFLIWRNEEINSIDNNTLNNLINDIIKYMTSDNYIKFKEKPILSINNPYKLTSRIKIISTLRSSVQKQIGKIISF